MTIKNVKPNYNSGFHQSYYEPINEHTYKGSYPIICRSLLEKKFCIYLDNNPNVKEWYSEPISIKYLNRWDSKMHTYYPDFIFATLDGDKYIVEVKPSKQLIKPKAPLRNSKKALSNYKYALQMYITNVSKVEAARQYATANNFKFIFITEKELTKFKLDAIN